MSTMRFINAMKTHAAGMDAAAAVGRWGIVTSADPVNILVKVNWQPEGTPSDWLPLLSTVVGNGWGMVHVPPLNTPVFCVPDMGDDQSYVVIGSTWSTSNRAPQGYNEGEIWLVHVSGASIKLTNNGMISLTDQAGTSLAFQNNGTATLTGTLLVTNDIIDQNGTRGTLASLRTAYVAHEHSGGTISGKTGTTDHTV